MNPPTGHVVWPDGSGASSSSRRVVWIDASAGVAGDMLLAALLDAGAAPDDVRAAVEAVVPAEVELRCHETTRAGLRTLRLEVTSLRDDHPHRSWAGIRQRLRAAELDEQVRIDALPTSSARARP